MRWPPWLMLLSAFLWVSGASLVHAGNNVWTSLGPAGGHVFALAVDPSTPTTLYAGMFYSDPECRYHSCISGGVYKSTDGGGAGVLWIRASTLPGSTP